MTQEEHIKLIYCTLKSFLPTLLTQLIPNTMATHAITYTNFLGTNFASRFDIVCVTET